MDDRAAFLAEIRSRPDDDTPRLVYADWFQEHGEDERAEFIRVQCELADLQREHADRLNDETDWSKCTELSATWCPNCGECSCPDPEYERNHHDCPIHGTASLHCCLEDLVSREGQLGRREIKLWSLLGDDYDIGPIQSRLSWEKIGEEDSIIIVDRGMGWRIRLSWLGWLTHHKTILSHPSVVLEQIELTTHPPLEWIREHMDQGLIKFCDTISGFVQPNHFMMMADTVKRVLTQQFPGHCPGRPIQWTLPGGARRQATNSFCTHCNGTGQGNNPDHEECFRCGGTGIVSGTD